MSEKPAFRTQDVHSILGGVSVMWLMRAFGMGRQTVERKLRGIKPIGSGKHDTPLYDLKEAAAYLVKPRIQMDSLLKELKPDDLPERLREAYWSAKLKQLRWEEKAGHLWPSPAVIELFSEVLAQIRTRTQLIPDECERVAGLSQRQVEVVRGIVDSIQDDMHKAIQAIAEGPQSLSMLGIDQEENPDEDARPQVKKRSGRDDSDIL